MAKRPVRYLAEQMTLKITLADSDPKIWRRVEVHSGLTLIDLHYVIQNVFEWQDAHLYHYIVPPEGKLTRKAMRDAVYYQGPHFDPDCFDEEHTRQAEDTLLASIFTDDLKQFVYEYDMGDSWMHLTKLEKRTPGGEQDHVQHCLAGENAAPPDDIGGIWGYAELLAALNHRSDKMRRAAAELLGDGFDPTHFDLAKPNWRLKQCFKPAIKKPRK